MTWGLGEEEELLTSAVAAFLIVGFLIPAGSGPVTTRTLGYICTRTRNHDQALEADQLIH